MKGVRLQIFFKWLHFPVLQQKYALSSPKTENKRLERLETFYSNITTVTLYLFLLRGSVSSTLPTNISYSIASH